MNENKENKENTISSVFSGIVSPTSKKPITITSQNTGIPIKIILDINIAGKSEKIPFTSSLLYIPPEEPKKSLLQFIPESTSSKTPSVPLPTIPDVALETYPRIPMQNGRLPSYQLKQLRYKEVVQFFFNKKIFAQKMEQWSKDSFFKGINEYINPIANTATEEENNMIETQDSYQRPSYLLSEREVENIQIEKENIELMLHLLFPTYPFYSEGYKTSMQYWNPSEPYLKNTFPKTQYSYIRRHGKIYTITNAVWLNDVFNVPFYRELIKYYEYYKDWKTERIQVLTLAKNRIKLKKERITGDDAQFKILEKEESIIEQVILLLQKNIMEKKELDELFKRSSRYSEIVSKYLKINPFNQSRNQLYFYSLLFSKESNRVLSYSNDRLNEIIYNESPTLTNKNIDKKPEKNNRDKELLEKMMENILDYAIHNGDIQYLARGICPKEGNSNCHSSKEISTFYYTGILNQSHSRSEPSYEIHVLMDVIEGEVNKKNIAGIKCQYENQSIGKKIEYLMGGWPAWDLSNRRIFMKLDSKDEIPLVSKTISEGNSNASISTNEQGEKRNINADIQKRMEKWIEFDKTQSEKKLKNSIEKLKVDIQNYSDKNSSYMQKVKNFDWSLDSKDNDIFLKWIQNPNKYPSPAEKETNDGYVAIDRKIYLFLEKMEVLFQSKSEKSSKIREITNIVEQINNTIFSIKRTIESNESKIVSPQWNYVKIIMEFYAGFLSFLINFLEYKKRKYQQEGADVLEGGGEWDMEDDSITPFTLIPPHSFYNKTQRNYEKKGRKTRKLMEPRFP